MIGAGRDDLGRHAEPHGDAEGKNAKIGRPIDGAGSDSNSGWPATGSVVGRFGPEIHPKWGTTTMNNGIDIQAPMGAAVHAVARGRVEYTSDDYAGYGEIVILNHGDGYYTLYAHLSDILVQQGASVESGQLIGKVGDTGSLKGPYLYFELRDGQKPLDPERWLSRNRKAPALLAGAKGGAAK